MAAVDATAVDGALFRELAAAVDQQDEGKRPRSYGGPAARLGCWLEKVTSTGDVAEGGDPDTREDVLGAAGARGRLARGRWLIGDGEDRPLRGGGDRAGQEHGEGKERRGETVRRHGRPSCDG
jgi:hypothetical protein